jgi:hypothetical protein
LILAKPVEEAFDRKRLCFVYNGIEQKFICRVLDPELRSATKWDGMPLNLPKDRSPYKRILSWHCICTLHNAIQRGWLQTPSEILASGESINYWRESFGAHLPLGDEGMTVY